jgi:hypothetical protein
VPENARAKPGQAGRLNSVSARSESHSLIMLW